VRFRSPALARTWRERITLSLSPHCLLLATHSLDTSELFHIAFYKFVALADVDSVVTRLREITRELTGGIIVAEEGINGVIAGEVAALDQFERTMRLDALFNGAFSDIVFKRSRCKTKPFTRMKVSRKAEIVAFGVEGAEGFEAGHTSVSPEKWRELIARDDVVVIDNRNSFEYRLGKFKNAIDPQVKFFRDFPKYVENNAATWKHDGKKIAMYCTGGIRCEKSSAWMEKQGLEVYQLEGGILNFFQSMPDAERDWEGECFVFDNRIAIDTKLQETETTFERVYEAEPDGAWRIARAKRLIESVEAPTTSLVIPKVKRPPARDGVNASCVAFPGNVEAWPLVIDFLVHRFQRVSRETWLERMAHGRVIDESGHAINADVRSKPHQKIYYYRSVVAEQRIPFDEVVLFRDEYLIVADKPHFLPVVPAGRYVQETVLTRLKRSTGIDTLSPIHRIDRDTAGLVAFAIQPHTRDAYQCLFRERRIEKRYEAIAPYRTDLSFPITVKNRLSESDRFMQMREDVDARETAGEGEPNAETQIDVIEINGEFARYALRPLTGQKHQLRMHMASLGLPIVNDRIYPLLLPDEVVATYDKPLQLLAKSIEFVDPMTGELRRFESLQRLAFD
jgi:UPF0176 protein